MSAGWTETAPGLTTALVVPGPPTARRFAIRSCSSIDIEGVFVSGVGAATETETCGAGFFVAAAIGSPEVMDGLFVDITAKSSPGLFVLASTVSSTTEPELAVVGAFVAMPALAATADLFARRARDLICRPVNFCCCCSVIDGGGFKSCPDTPSLSGTSNFGSVCSAVTSGRSSPSSFSPVPFVVVIVVQCTVGFLSQSIYVCSSASSS
mmetsp:Transcript_12957/g.31555  ORF Transcript_12957/g.31555 Transcript_12957/m.31555 type:complete len:209 (+) Transcript_12957:3549-4175(+)